MSKPQSQQKSQDVGHVDLAAMKDSVEKSVTKRSAPRRRSDAATGAKKQQQPTTGAAAAAAAKAVSISTGADASSGGGSGSFQPQQHPEKEIVVTPRAPIPVVVTPEKQHLPMGGELQSRSGDPTPVKWPQHATATTAPPGPLPAMISSLSSQQKEQQQQRTQQHQASFVSVNGTDTGVPLLIRPPAVTALSRLSQRTLTQQDEQQQQPSGGSHPASKLSAASEPKTDQSGSRTLGADPIVVQASTALPPVVRMTDDVRAVVAPVVPTTTHPAPAAQTRKSDLREQAPAGEAVSGAVKSSANAATQAKAGASSGAAHKQEQHDSGVSAGAVKQRQQPVRPKPLGLEALGLVPTPRSSQPATAMPVGRSAAAAAAMQRSSAYPRATTQPLPQRATAHTHIPPAAAAAAHVAQPKQKQQQQQRQVARADAEKLQAMEKASSGTVIPVPPPGPPPVIKEISPAKPSMNSAAAQAQQSAQPRVMHRRVDSLQQQLLAAPQTLYLPQQQQQVELTRAPAAHYLTPVASVGLDESLSRVATAMQPATAPPMAFSPLSSTEQQLQWQQLAAPEVWWAHRQEPELAAAAQQLASVEQQPAVYYGQQPQVDQRWVEYAPQAQMPQQLVQQPQQQYQTQSQQQPTYNMNTGQAILNYNNAAAGFGSNEMTTYYPPVYDPYSQQQPQYVVQPPVYYDVAPASYYNAGASTAGYYAPASASGGAMVDGYVWNM